MAVTLRNWEMRARTALPIAGADVYLYAATLTHPNAGAVLAQTTTNVSGMWEFVDLDDGQYDVKIELPGEDQEKWYKGNGSFSFTVDTGAVQNIAAANPIINGDFNVWQRGTSFAAAANGSYTADRWLYTNTATGVDDSVHTISRSADVPAVSGVYPLQNYSLLVDCTDADATTDAGDLVHISQRIEGFNFLPIAQRTFTLSFWVKATKTGTYCIAFSNSGSDRVYVAEYTITGTDWEYKEITVSASPSAGTWNYTTGIGLSVAWVLQAGSTYNTAVNNTWNSSAVYATTNQVNACDSTSNDFRLSQVRITPGATAASFAPRPIAVEEYLCRRYFERLADNGAFIVYGSGICQTTTTGQIILPFQHKRAAPTLSFSAANTFQLIHSGTVTNLTAVSAGQAYTNSALITATIAGSLTVGNGAYLRAGNSSSLIDISAEL